LLVIEEKLSEGQFDLLDEYRDSVENVENYEKVRENYERFA
jgi:hypothetical protein